MEAMAQWWPGAHSARRRWQSAGSGNARAGSGCCASVWRRLRRNRSDNDFLPGDATDDAVAVFVTRGQEPAERYCRERTLGFGDAQPRLGSHSCTISVEAGGSVDLSTLSLPSGCVGWAALAPDVIVNFSESGTRLRFYASSSSDTALAVLDPNGSWHCNDDTEGNDPDVTVTPARTWNLSGVGDDPHEQQRRCNAGDHRADSLNFPPSAARSVCPFRRESQLGELAAQLTSGQTETAAPFQHPRRVRNRSSSAAPCS